MSKITIKINLLICLMICLSLRCSFKNPANNFKLIVAQDTIETLIAVEVINPQTNQSVPNVTIVIDGPDKNRIMNFQGEYQNKFYAKTGFLDFSVENNFIPTFEQPLEISILAEANGYISTNKQFYLYSTGEHPITLPLVEVGNPPDGIVFIQKANVTATQGSIVNDVHLITPKDPVSGSNCSIFIPAGMIVRDDNNNLLNGNLVITLGYYNNRSEKALLSYPGNFSGEIEGESQLFTSAGLAVIEIKDEDGHLAKTFAGTGIASKNRSLSVPEPLITILIPPNTFNPQTGRTVQRGDVVPVWQYYWHQVSGIAIGTDPAAPDYFVANFPIQNIGTYFIGWASNSCGVKIFNIVDSEGKPNTIPIKISYQRAGSQVSCIATQQTWWEVLENYPIKLTAYYNDHLIGQQEYSNMCSEDNLDFKVDLTNLQIISRTLEITTSCEDRVNLLLRPSGVPIRFRKLVKDGVVGPTTFAGSLVNGKLAVKGLEVGNSYKFLINYEEVSESITLKITSNSAEIVSTSTGISEPLVDNDIISFTMKSPQSVCEGM
jgi:hypothetical protein